MNHGVEQQPEGGWWYWFERDGWMTCSCILWPTRRAAELALAAAIADDGRRVLVFDLPTRLGLRKAVHD